MNPTSKPILPTIPNLPSPVLALLLALFLTIVSAGKPSAALAETVAGTQGMVIKADIMTHNQAEDIIRASGAVNILWKGITMTANEAEYNQRTQTIAASGNVTLKRGEDTLHGDSLTLDTVTGMGEMNNTTMSLRQENNFHVSGKKIIRDKVDELSVQQGSITTCDALTPSWKFDVKELKLNQLGYATANDVVFYIKDTPLLYLPWIAFPVVRDRQSGFLFPRFGWSSKKGAELGLSYYWTISPSQDLTVSLDSLTKRGLGTGLDYRYIRSRGSEGAVNGYLIYDLEQDRWRGQLAQKHKEIFSPDMNLRTSINITSDHDFFNDYGEKAGDYNRQSNDSSINFLKTWQNYALTASMRFSEDYYSANNSRTLQTLPEIGLAAVRQQVLSTPVYFDMDASAANFYREQGPQGQRLNAFPRLTLATGLPGYLNASFYAGAHLRAYNTVKIPHESSAGQNDAKILPEAGIHLSSSLSRVYEVNGENLKKLRHELIPEISYTYAPSQDQSRLPLYDYSDRLIHQNIVYFGITSLLGGKFQNGEVSEYREISRISLMQGYSIEGTRRDLLTMVDANRPWSDLILESDTRLNQLARLTFDARYNVYDSSISSAAPGLEFDDRLGNTANISYHMSRNNVEYMEARLAAKIVKPWAFGYSNRYSFDRGESLESLYSVEYRHQCWSINVAFRDRPGNQSYLFNFNLAGLAGTK